MSSVVKVKTYYLPPTPLIPNSPLPLIHYPQFFGTSSSPWTAAQAAATLHERLDSNGWQTQWIFRYGSTQPSHYHSAAHECMAVLTGTAKIRFGLGDTDGAVEGKGCGGVEVEAQAGDIFVLPAGTAHKTFDAKPEAPFKLMTPGDGHGIFPGSKKSIDDILTGLQLDGFTMLGAYPFGSRWDFRVGGEDAGHFDAVWNIKLPDHDPVLGDRIDGICGLWKSAGSAEM